MKQILFLLSFISFCINVEAKGKPKPVKGIDISHNQDKIDWKKLASQKTLKFVIIRSSMGDDRRDKKFSFNFSQAKKYKLLVGTYHYYDPNENSTRQALNYLKSSKQKENDIIPILDFENLSKVQSKTKLISGIKNWLSIVEKKTGYKPIIYTGLSFYKTYIEGNFDDYPYWVAAYSTKRKYDSDVLEADIRQISQSGKVKGIRGSVDLNVTDSQKLKNILRKKPAR